MRKPVKDVLYRSDMYVEQFQRRRYFARRKALWTCRHPCSIDNPMQGSVFAPCFPLPDVDIEAAKAKKRLKSNSIGIAAADAVPQRQSKAAALMEKQVVQREAQRFRRRRAKLRSMSMRFIENGPSSALGGSASRRRGDRDRDRERGREKERERELSKSVRISGRDKRRKERGGVVGDDTWRVVLPPARHRTGGSVDGIDALSRGFDPAVVLASDKGAAQPALQGSPPQDWSDSDAGDAEGKVGRRR